MGDKAQIDSDIKPYMKSEIAEARQLIRELFAATDELCALHTKDSIATLKVLYKARLAIKNHLNGLYLVVGKVRVGINLSKSD